MALAGWRLEDVITEQDVLDLLWRQKELNFPPGDQMLYSNTGYTLLGLIVKRVSGMPLSQFAQQHIFQPLGMTHTHFQDDYSRVVRNRAYSYLKDHDVAYKYVALSYSTVGPSSLFTTVEDMAKWDENFYTGKVGGKQLIADLQLQGKLNSGKEINYADGLIIAKYRGLNTVWHNGGDAGYRTNILRFPDQHFTVVVLSNAGEMDPSDQSYKIADIYLAGKLEAATAKAPTPTAISVDPKLLAEYVGEYALSPSFIVSFTLEDGQLMAQATGQPKFPVYPSGKDTVFWKVVDAHFTFERAGDGGAVTGGVHHQNGRETPAKKITRTPLSTGQLKDFVGDYYSDELAVLYSVSEKNGSLSLRYPRGELALHQGVGDIYSANFPIGSLQFTRGADGACTGFTIGDGRVRKLRFDKVTITPAASPPMPQASRR